MDSIRRHGQPPFRVAVIHGGPGAPGEMAPVARELAADCGVLEPLQTADSVQGQIEELRTSLAASAEPPTILIGFSWGAWLSFLVAANYPGLVKKLILVRAGPFEEQYAAGIMETRLGRLAPDQRAEVVAALETLNAPSSDGHEAELATLGKLLGRADAFDPLECESFKEGECQPEVFQRVWSEAAELRRCGRLLEFGRLVTCPVVAIHGDYDPHPASGVQEPLSRILKDFRLIRLANCGHKPWSERQARQKFYHILRREIGAQSRWI